MNDLFTIIPAAFHAAVLSLGSVLLWYAHRMNRALMQSMEMERLKRMEPEDPHRQRIVDAANDWYDDKKNSKERLRAVIEQSRGLAPYKLIMRPGDVDQACRVCGAGADQPCDAGFHS